MKQESWYVLIYLLPSPYRLCRAKYSSCKFLCSCLSVQQNKVLTYTTLRDLSSVYRTVSTLNTKTQQMCHARSYTRPCLKRISAQCTIPYFDTGAIPPSSLTLGDSPSRDLHCRDQERQGLSSPCMPGPSAKPLFWSGYDHGIFTLSWDVKPCKPYNNMVKSKDKAWWVKFFQKDWIPW
jgi:hypothetical protein